VGVEKRRDANQLGIYSWRDPKCNAELLGVKGKKTQPVLQALLNINQSNGAYKAQLFIYSRALGRIQGYQAPVSYLIGRGWEQTAKGVTSRGNSCMGRLAPVNQNSTLSKGTLLAGAVNEAIKWVRRIRREGATWSVLPKPTGPPIRPSREEEIKEGTFNMIVCSGCGSIVPNTEPVLYHDMVKGLMIYVDPDVSQDKLEIVIKDIKESNKGLSREGLPEPGISVLDNMEDLGNIVSQLDDVECPDGTYPENMSQEDWKDLVDALITPARPWPLDHKCICGEKIRTVCFCIEQGAFIDMRDCELNFPDEIGVECKNCGRVMLGFSCEKCNCIYDWQIGIVDQILE